MGTPTRTREFRQQMKLPFPLLSDPRRVSYRLYGLLRVGRTVRPRDAARRMFWLTWRGLRRGGALSRDQSMAQLGGVFLVDTGGIVRYARLSHEMHDNPRPAELLRAGAALD
jgi:alkyl hydroperoxide reductase subunit AhpC